MRAFCSFLRCLGAASTGTVDVEARESSSSGHGKDGLEFEDGKAEFKAHDLVKQGSFKARLDRDSASLQKVVIDGDAKPYGQAFDACGPTADVKPSNGAYSVQAVDMLHHERTLRALLQQAKIMLAQQSQLLQQPQPAESLLGSSSTGVFLADPLLQRLNTQLLEMCSTPRPDGPVFLRIESVLGEVRQWMGSSSSPASATAVLYAIGDGLAHAEHIVRSAGQVRFWQPDTVAAFLALLHVYHDVLLQAGRAAQQQRLQNQQQHQQKREEAGLHPHPHVQQQRTGGDDVPSEDKKRQTPASSLQHTPSTQDSNLSSNSKPDSEVFDQGRPSAPQQPTQQQLQQPQQPPLVFAAAALLLRPDWLDMLSEVLELLHFNEDYSAAAARAGRAPQEAVAAALQLWGFLTQLVKFAAAHAESVQRMGACLQRLAALLSPPSGAVARLLELPLREDTLVAQLHALWLLQVLYDMPDAKVLYSPILADYYVALHHNSMILSYESSGADPKSASAELCRIHATLLRSLARHPGPPVRAAFARMRTVEWLLAEMSLESQLLPAAHHSGEGALDESSEVESDSDVEDGHEHKGHEGAREASEKDVAKSVGQESTTARRDAVEAAPNAVNASGSAACEGSGAAAAASGAAADGGNGGKGFEFTYDLNEDVERLIALEDELGHDLELEGFEYDEEGKRLKAQSEARQAEAAEAAAVAAATTPEKGCSRVQTPPQLPQLCLGATGSGDLDSGKHCSWGGEVDACKTSTPAGSSVSRRSSGVPRLALVGLRAASISSMAAGSSVQSPGPRHHRRVSAANSAWGASTFCEEEGSDMADENEDAEEGMSLPDDGSGRAVEKTVAAERVARWSMNLPEPSVSAIVDTNSGGAAPAGSSGCRNGYLPSLQSCSRPGCGGAAAADAPPGSTASDCDGRGSASSGTSASSNIEPAASDAPGAPPAVAAAPLASKIMPQRSLRVVQMEGSSGEDTPAPLSPGARELTVASPLHSGPQGELHLMAPSSNSARLTNRSSGSGQGSGRPPLPYRAALVPPLRMASTGSAIPASVAASADGPPGTSSAASSARGPPPSSSRAMVLLSASNRANGGVWTTPSALSSHRQLSPSPSLQFPATAGSSPSKDNVRLSFQQPLASPARPGEHSASTSPGTAIRPSPPLIPALNLQSLRRRDSHIPNTDTGRTAPLSALLRASTSSALPNGGAMDSGAGTEHRPAPHTTPYRGGDVLAAPGESLQRPSEPVRLPAAEYQQLAAQRLLYQDPVTHILMLKVLLDLLVTPAGALDPMYVPQHPTEAGTLHAEHVLLWHLNAPRNGGVVHDLCRGAQRRAKQAAAAAAAKQSTNRRLSFSSASAANNPANRSPNGGSVPPNDSAREYQGVAGVTAGGRGSSNGSQQMAAIAASPPASRPCAITRTLQLLSRPLFNASRYSNLQFMSRGAFGGIYRARMDLLKGPALPGNASGTRATSSGSSSSVTAAPPVAPGGATSVQVVIKTIQLPGSSFDGCVLADVFGEVTIMERFSGHDCICQLLDYGMHDDAYWIVMRRYRCSLAEWRARQRPLNPATAGQAAAVAATAAAARVFLSALSQVVDALRLLASHNVVHFDLKCSNVLIEPLSGVRDGELWAPVGNTNASSVTTGNSSSNAAASTADSATSASGAGKASASAHVAPFRCVLADFGEARAYRSAAEAFTARNRGTEVFKSPEMLLLNATSRTSNGSGSSGLPPHPPPPLPPPAPSSGRQALTYAPKPPAPPSTGRSPVRPSGPSVGAGSRHDHPQHPPQQSLAGAGLASDVWSLGCLAYELLSGTVLFGGDYASVTHRVAFGSGDHLTLTEVERARLGNLPLLVSLVEWILARDPAKRPSLERIRERIESTRAALAGLC
ncbi:hypothetical protein Agub_g10082 [Astrephomene gubernaculifera]|uniref:Protein kinase domain-containing protein n=1 Tax=Astrephomene gubernaculifera TaxID=47775 RepID=A0AAD3DWY2_9CHLO|nr:hypothetical protein Agub_g10082 [Astrephomene gubernaculifera]